MVVKSRPVQESGIVIAKEFKKAMESFTGSDGRVVPAQPDRYVVTAVSSYEFSQEEGYKNPAILDYKVEKEVFEKIKFGTKVVVVYEMSNSNSPKPISLTIKA